MSIESSSERQVYCVVPRGTTWDVQEDGRPEAVGSRLQREEAIALARSLAEATSFGQIIVYGADGLLEYESTCAKRAVSLRRQSHA